MILFCNFLLVWLALIFPGLAGGGGEYEENYSSPKTYRSILLDAGHWENQGYGDYCGIAAALIAAQACYHRNQGVVLCFSLPATIAACAYYRANYHFDVNTIGVISHAMKMYGLIPQSAFLSKNYLDSTAQDKEELTQKITEHMSDAPLGTINDFWVRLEAVLKKYVEGRRNDEAQFWEHVESGDLLLSQNPGLFNNQQIDVGNVKAVMGAYQALLGALWRPDVVVCSSDFSHVPLPCGVTVDEFTRTLYASLTRGIPLIIGIKNLYKEVTATGWFTGTNREHFLNTWREKILDIDYEQQRTIENQYPNLTPGGHALVILGWDNETNSFVVANPWKQICDGYQGRYQRTTPRALLFLMRREDGGEGFNQSVNALWTADFSFGRTSE